MWQIWHVGHVSSNTKIVFPMREISILSPYPPETLLQYSSTKLILIQNYIYWWPWRHYSMAVWQDSSHMGLHPGLAQFPQLFTKPVEPIASKLHAAVLSEEKNWALTARNSFYILYSPFTFHRIMHKVLTLLYWASAPLSQGEFSFQNKYFRNSRWFEHQVWLFGLSYVSRYLPLDLRSTWLYSIILYY